MMSESRGCSEEKQLFAEISKHGRASCKKCKRKCVQGQLRIAKLVPSLSSLDKPKNWYHIGCIFETFLHQRQTTKRIETLHDIDGLENLSEEHKSEILEKIQEYNKALEAKSSVKSSKMQKSGKKLHVSSASNNEDAISCCSFDISNRESHEDNSFRKFRTIIVNVADVRPASEKTKVLSDLFTKGSDGSGFKSDIFLWCKLLLPASDKRVFDLQTNQILKIFSKIFQKNQNDMSEYLEQGDLGQAIQYYFEHNEKLKPMDKSYITMQEVDDFLEKLATLKNEDEQIAHFRDLAKRCTANDLKVVVRCIKRDLRMFAETKQILDAVHPKAYKMFKSGNDLKSAVNNCLIPSMTEPMKKSEEDNKPIRKRRTRSNSSNVSETPKKRKTKKKLLDEKPPKKEDDYDDDDDDFYNNPPKHPQEDMNVIFDRLKNCDNSLVVPESSKSIPNYFQNMKLLLEDGLAENQAECARYFIAFGGTVLKPNEFEEATHVLHSRDTVNRLTIPCPSSARHVIVKWIRDTVDKECLQDFRPYTVRWDPNVVL